MMKQHMKHGRLTSAVSDVGKVTKWKTQWSHKCNLKRVTIGNRLMDHSQRTLSLALLTILSKYLASLAGSARGR
jgi:hypothetical protein